MSFKRREIHAVFFIIGTFHRPPEDLSYIQKAESPIACESYFLMGKDKQFINIQLNITNMPVGGVVKKNQAKSETTDTEKDLTGGFPLA